MRSKTGSFTNTVTALTFTLFFAVILLLVVFAAVSYRSSTGSAGLNAGNRAVLSYMAGCVRSGGASDIYIADRSGTECLVLEGSDGFEQRFYEHDGRLMEEYVSRDTAPDPGSALEIGECGSLALSMDRSGLLTIKTGRGTSYVDTGRMRDHEQ